ncbi:MAG: glutamyl-tRNA reductase [Lentisphaeria bacterium]|nr:glutamyl-tRNA reductase [Lentisphaeria bacterium]
MINLLGCDHRLKVDEREAIIKELEPELYGDYVYLQTCNRVELYRGDGASEEKLVKHLFRVISGLESKMLGEIHIQGQVKRAFNEAVAEKHISSGLHRLFQAALRCGKRVRTKTELSNGSSSHAHATLVTVKRHFGPFGHTKVLVLGVNHLTERVVTLLNYSTEDIVTICNRTDSKAQELAEKMSSSFLPFRELENKVGEFDIVVSATTSPEIIIKQQWFKSTELRKRLLIDLALPRDIDPSCSELDNTSLFNLDDVEREVSESMAYRQQELVLAEQIIAEEVANFLKISNKGNKSNDQTNK